MAEEKPTEPKIDDVAGLTAAFVGAAPVANRFYLTLTPVSGRLSFVEFPSGVAAPPQYRAAVTLSVSDLVALRDLLNEHLKDVRTLPTEGQNGAEA